MVGGGTGSHGVGLEETRRPRGKKEGTGERGAMDTPRIGQQPWGVRVWEAEAGEGLLRKETPFTCKGKTRENERVGWEVGKAVAEKGPTGAS